MSTRTMALGLTSTLALVSGAIFVGSASAEPAPDRVWVCKYVGKPGDAERLKPGKNPIGVSVNSIDTDGPVEINDLFADGQELSYVIAFQENPSDKYTGTPCPATPPGEETPTEEPTEGPTEEPTEGPTEEPTEGPTEEPTEGPTDGPTEEPTDEPKPPTPAQPDPPVAAPTDLAPASVAGAAGLFAAATALLGAAGYALRGQRQH